MKYDKGSFITIPNKGIIAREEAWVQSVYLWICSFADEDGTCYPSIPTISELAGCSESSCRRAIEKLETLGVLAKTNRRDGKMYLSSVYQIVLVSARQEGGVPQAPGGGVPQNTELNPPSLTKSNELPYKVVEENPKKPRTTLDGFESWWMGYPRKSNKTGASAEWRKLTTADRHAAIQRNFDMKGKWPETRFVVMPDKYLRDRRWEDEITIKSEPKTYRY